MTRFAPLLALAVLQACSSDDTQLVVWVSSDLTVPLSHIAVTIIDEQLETLFDELIPLTPGELPISFGVVPGPDYVDAQVLIVVGAIDENAERVLERRAVTGFVRGERLLLPMFLAARCASTSCTEDGAEVCTERGCEALEIPKSTLQSISPGDELSHDAGTPQGPSGADGGGADGGPADGGLDPCGCTPDQVCVHQTEVRSCAPPDACTCVAACDPFSGGCPAPRVCTILDPNGPIAGACLGNRGGQALGMSCTTEWSADYQKTSDSCNTTNNLVCIGASSSDPTSTCSIYCKVAAPQCPNQLSCVPNRPPDSPIGTCANVPRTYPDNGDTCAGPFDCGSDLCMFGRCATSCADYASCPVDAACVTVGPSERYCATLCELDSECRGTLICEPYGAVKVCVPFCSDSGYCPPGRSCQPNGHCG